MRSFFLTCITCLLFLVSYSKVFSDEKKNLTDTSIIHKIDGSANEWPAADFIADSATGISCAMDNDRQNLYIVLVTSNPGEQNRIMRMGMKLFIDLKEKKKETRGVEFPVIQGEVTQYHFENTSENGAKPDLNMMRAQFKLNNITMKLFGFEGQPEDQGLTMPNSAQIAFNWNSQNNLAIEYVIPLQLFGKEQKDMEKKPIEIGWKINSMTRPPTSSNEGGYSRSEEESGHSGGFNGGGGRGGRGGGGGGYHGGGGHGGGYGGSGGSNKGEKVVQEQAFWTKYNFKE